MRSSAISSVHRAWVTEIPCMFREVTKVPVTLRRARIPRFLSRENLTVHEVDLQKGRAPEAVDEAHHLFPLAEI